MAVYFIQARDDEGPVKIGFCGRDVSTRMSQLQALTPDAIEVMRVLPDACRVVERWLHGHYAARLIRGEWFRFTPEMRTIEPPTRRDAIRDLRGLVSAVGAETLGRGIRRAPPVIYQWSHDGGAPAEWAAKLAAAAADHGFAVSPATLCRSEAA